MKICVVGAGGVGGIFGPIFQKLGHEVSYLARGAHLQEIQKKGLTLLSPLGDRTVLPFAASDRASDLVQGGGPPDLVLLCVKTWQVEPVLEEVAKLMGPQTLVLPLENGVDTSELLASRFGPRSVLRGLCAVISYVESPGVIRHLGPPPILSFGELEAQKGEGRGSLSPRIEALAKDLFSSEVDQRIPQDIIAAQWQKFLFICSFGAVSSLVGLKKGEYSDLPEIRILLRGAMAEIECVARAKGVQLPKNAVEIGMNSVDAVPADGTSSMQRDFRSGRRTELESFSGTVVRLSRELGIAVPIHQLCYQLLLPRELYAKQKMGSREGEQKLG